MSETSKTNTSNVVACEQAPKSGIRRRQNSSSGDRARLADFSFRPIRHLGACSQATNVGIYHLHFATEEDSGLTVFSSPLPSGVVSTVAGGGRAHTGGKTDCVDQDGRDRNRSQV